MTALELRDEPLELDIVDSDLVYEGRVWDIRSDTISYGDGEIVRQYVDHPGAVRDRGASTRSSRVLLIQQYRHPIRLRDWEIPAGLLDVEGEPPLQTAQRELVEEVDLGAAEWEPLVSIFTTPGGNDEVAHSSSPGSCRRVGGARTRTGGGRHSHRTGSPLHRCRDRRVAVACATASLPRVSSRRPRRSPDANPGAAGG